jgi:signal transduction histidine kinase/CheY-like chemotaxis protein
MPNPTHETVLAWSFEFQDKLEQLERQTFWIIIVLIAAAAVIPLALMASTPDNLPHLAVSFACLGAAALLALLNRVNYLLAAWSAVAASFLILWSFTGPLGLASLVGLSFIPCGLAILSISRPAGALAAGLLTLFLAFAPPQVLPVDGAARLGAGAAAWLVVGLIWMTLNPLLVTVQWAWSGYRQSLALLEEARATQVKLSQALEDLSGMNSQLTQMNRLAQNLRAVAEEERSIKEQFVANVSHELRTPLNMIIGFCETLAEARSNYGVSLPPAMQADLAVVLRNSQHLSSLIDDVLDLSQIEAGQMALSKERASIVEIVEAAAVAVRPLYESKNLYLRVETGDGEALPPVLCDRTRIREVILNLLSNAGRFTEKGGVTIHVCKEEQHIRVNVRDTGPGISAEAQERLFQPFQQLDPSIRRRWGGTGLGLSISKRFVELHDGQMGVQSCPGEGATFFFKLPLEPALPPDSGALRWINRYGMFVERTRPPVIEAAPAPPRLVVVERGDVLSRLLRRYLENAEVKTLASLEEAARDLAELPAQALLVNTERVEDALRGLREQPALPSGVPALLCSLPDASVLDRDARIAGYLVKPVRKDTLLAALDGLGTLLKTILIVDDEPDVLLLFRRMLRSAGRGYQVLRAETGKQALEIIAQKRPDVILLDLVMPEMDGFRFLALRDEDPDLREIPVFLISARDPHGQPIVADSLAIAHPGGLSIQKLLSYIQFTVHLLARTELAERSPDPARPADPRGSAASE